MKRSRRTLSSVTRVAVVIRCTNVRFSAVLASLLLGAAPFTLAGDIGAPQNRVQRSGGEEPLKAKPQADAAETGQSVLLRATERAKAEKDAAQKSESTCFTIDSDDSPGPDQKLYIPRQTICPFVRLPGMQK